MRKYKLKNKDLLKSRNYLLSLKDEVNKMRIVYNHTPAAFIMHNPDFSIVSVNSYIKKFTHLRPKDMIGKKCYELLADGFICPKCPVEKCMRMGDLEWNIKKEPSPDGGEQYILQKAVPIYEHGKLVNVLEIVVDRTEQERLAVQLHEDFLDTIQILASMIELHDTYTGGHSYSVKEISVRLAKEIGLSEKEVEEIEIAAVLHDIGKVGIKDYILNKVEQLTGEESLLIKQHPETGERALNKIKRLEGPRVIIRHHHERYDGKGYPDGLTADRIPLGARILAVADAYDAMTSDRAYRRALDEEDALKEIMKCKGSQFDPLVVDTFYRCFAGRK